jgi:homoserine kinase
LTTLTVDIPATSANLGPGFDSLGLALDLWNSFTLIQDDALGEIAFELHGEGADSLPTDNSNLVARTLLAELDRLARDERGHRHVPPAIRHPSVRIISRNGVPCGSGLGSSSTAVLAGLVFAHALADPRPISMDKPGLIATVLREAAQVEGHGDNIAPALLGGLIAVSTQEGKVLARRIPMPPARVVVCVPEFSFLTIDARARLPVQIPRSNAVYNIGRALLVADALRSGDMELLREAMGDRIHEPYRFPAIPGAEEARREALAEGAAAVCLSGAGPGLLAFAAGQHDRIGEAMRVAFEQAGVRSRAWVLAAAEQGVRISN